MNYLIFSKYKINNRIFKNVKSYIYTFFSKIFSQILYIPLMFYFWGVEATGVWIFLTSILNSVNIFNINASEYSFQELILTNKKNIENIYSNSLIITFINSLIISLIFFLLFYFFFSNLDILNSINIKNLFEILISLTIIFFLQNLINFLYIHFYVRGELNFNNYNRELIDLTYKLIIPFSGYMYSDLRILSFFYLILISSNFIYLLFVIKRKSNIHFQIRLINFTQIKKIFYGSLNFNYINLIGWENECCKTDLKGTHFDYLFNLKKNCLVWDCNKDDFRKERIDDFATYLAYEQIGEEALDCVGRNTTLQNHFNYIKKEFGNHFLYNVAKNNMERWWRDKHKCWLSNGQCYKCNCDIVYKCSTEQEAKELEGTGGTCKNCPHFFKMKLIKKDEDDSDSGLSDSDSD